MKLSYIKIFLAILFVGFVSCNEFDDDVKNFVGTSGEVDFSNYVAIGDALTAGYTDNALFISGQESSYPAILAEKMKLAGGGEFNIPLMQDNTGGFKNLGIQGRLELKAVNGSLTPVPNAPLSDLDNISGKYNNMGIPGAKAQHLLFNGYGNPANLQAGMANPYFIRMASSTSATVLEDVLSQKPTFYTLWIGNNDILGYATNGGDENLDQISDPNIVTGVIDAILSQLDATGAKGAIANIPNVKYIAYFTTVPHAPLSPSNPDFGGQIATLNQSFASLNKVFEALGVPERKIIFHTDKASPVVIKDESLTDLSQQITSALVQGGADQGTAFLYGLLYGQARQATAEDLLVFTSQTIIGKKPSPENAYSLDIMMQLMNNYGLNQEQAGPLSIPGITYPLEDKWVLTPEEQKEIEDAVNAYNSSIADLASKYDIALVDTNAAMKELKEKGLVFFGNTFTTQFLQGGAFSLDGVHLTGKGYAIVANMFSEAINAKYGSNLRTSNPNNYPGVIIP